MVKKNINETISKASQILINDFSKQCFVIKGFLHGLQDAIIQQVKFSLFLELINFHSDIGLVPPGLHINIEPPGYKIEDNSDIWPEWKDQLFKCSCCFVKILKKHYLKEIKTNAWLRNSLKSQCINALILHKKCSKEAAADFVESWINDVVQKKVNGFIDLFHRQNYEISKENFNRFARQKLVFFI